MNIQEYISSGILEAYLLDELLASEKNEVEKNIAIYPELKEELNKIEDTLEAFAFKAAIQPRAHIKENILLAISDNKPGAKVVEVNFGYWRWAAAASLIFGLIASYMAYDYRDKWLTTSIALNEIISRNQQIAQDYNNVNQRLDKIQNDFSIIENGTFTKVVMKGTPNEPEAIASVYWNAKTQEAYLSIQNLKDISREKQFQLWAIVDGKPVDMGVFDNNVAGLIKMKNISNPQAFAVTVEPHGGKPSPTLETMRVVGNLPKV